MEIKDIGCDPKNYRAGRAGFRPSAIVIHVAEGSLASVDSWFHNPMAQVSAHYCVGKAGEVHQYVKEEDTAYHAGSPVNPTWKLLRPGVNANFYTIGIEHEGTALDAWTDAQYQASAELVGAIAKRWSIPVDEEHVPMHREIRGSKTCPGFVFERATLLALVGQLAPSTLGKPMEKPLMTLTKVNVRIGGPERTGTVLTTLDAGTPLRIAGAIRGEEIDGNAAWYRLAEGGFVWAGGTNEPSPAVG